MPTVHSVYKIAMVSHFEAGILMRLLNISWMALFLTIAAAAQSPTSTPITPRRIEVSKLGPQISEQVPDFSLTDQNGKVQTLESIIGPKGAMLVFIRSADW